MASREGDTERPSILVVSALPTLYALLVMRLLSARSGGLLHPSHPRLMLCIGTSYLCQSGFQCAPICLRN
jgi:hypothetical protein